MPTVFDQKRRLFVACCIPIRTGRFEFTGAAACFHGFSSFFLQGLSSPKRDVAARSPCRVPGSPSWPGALPDSFTRMSVLCVCSHGALVAAPSSARAIFPPFSRTPDTVWAGMFGANSAINVVQRREIAPQWGISCPTVLQSKSYQSTVPTGVWHCPPLARTRLPRRVTTSVDQVELVRQSQCVCVASAHLLARGTGV